VLGILDLHENPMQEATLELLAFLKKHRYSRPAAPPAVPGCGGVAGSPHRSRATLHCQRVPPKRPHQPASDSRDRWQSARRHSSLPWNRPEAARRSRTCRHTEAW